VAQETGTLSDRALAIGRHPGFADIAIAATANAHDLLLLTRNGRRFAPLAVVAVDPVAGLPAD
jgi:predicted nucleic acid-binding protein